jgi:hypothetical protein
LDLASWLSAVAPGVVRFVAVGVVGEPNVLLPFVVVGVKGAPSLPDGSFVRFFLRNPRVGIKSAFDFLSGDAGLLIRRAEACEQWPSTTAAQKLLGLRGQLPATS